MRQNNRCRGARTGSGGSTSGTLSKRLPSRLRPTNNHSKTLDKQFPPLSPNPLANNNSLKNPPRSMRSSSSKCSPLLHLRLPLLGPTPTPTPTPTMVKTFETITITNHHNNPNNKTLATPIAIATTTTTTTTTTTSTTTPTTLPLLAVRQVVLKFSEKGLVL